MPPPNCPGVKVPLWNCPGVKLPELAELGSLNPKPSNPDAKEQSIWVSVWLIDASVCVIVLLRFWLRFIAEAWFAVTPAGIEIIIANENPSAIITSSALIFRLEMFLTALVNTPKFAHLSKFGTRRRPRMRILERVFLLWV